jgi:hypothetical protein
VKIVLLKSGKKFLSNRPGKALPGYMVPRHFCG